MKIIVEEMVVDIQKIKEESEEMLRMLAKIKHLQSLRTSNYVWIRIELTDKEKKFLKYFDKYKNFNKPELWRKCGLGRTQFYSYFHRLQNVYPDDSIKLRKT